MTSVTFAPVIAMTDLDKRLSGIRPQINKLLMKPDNRNRQFILFPITIPGVFYEQMRLLSILLKLRMQHA